MSDKSEKEITMTEVAKHNTQEDCWLVIGNDRTGGPKVYDVTTYLDDHPGGAEVLLDVSGQDSDEFFEDIGHSKDAREELEKLLVGVLKLDEAEIQRRAEAAQAAADKAGGGSTFIVLIGIILAIAYAYFKMDLF
uniref:Cytochrome b5 heme-binding domain-containing protein n=1 Tax=Chaetoceros debilis TaxID=122233 RepID=A0A7S3V505_9STRA|eukprot:CAMPEP_0194072784 /NCGR_PEP_ID=MMETSP0149-20130528/427_1 /TAXON_ID=122233 /ORGANISM="Chaetoceros debilis, Strain MM31A-1" /LENGTH=134 /DNA_ID=CAMNT_0038752693 /DNA_START=100 /DNA_END=504 /DNA_ORIENTATION=+